jgi:MFS family permease
MGLVSSILELVSILSLPFIGLLADRTSSRRLILVALLLYPLVGLAYFVSGFFDAALFVILARGINGLTWELETVGIATYYRRVSHKGRIARSFGYLDSLSNAGWILSALASLLLIRFLPTHYLLLATCPFALGAFFIARAAPFDSPPSKEESDSHTHRRVFKHLFRHWFQAANQQKILTAVIFLSSVLAALTDFFIPIESYRAGANIQMIVLLAIFAAAPSLFGFHLGKLSDSISNRLLVALGLTVIAVTLVTLLLFTNYWIKLPAIFLIGVIVELFAVIKGRQVTLTSSTNQYGLRGSIFESLTTGGEFIAPIMLGLTIDILSFSNLLMLIAGAAVLLAVAVLIRAVSYGRSGL